jgi:REP element-mobilizing transposase RayT
MEGKFQNKYRIASARAPWWDYGQDAAYFVTICTAGRKHFLGDVVNGIMKLSHVGIIADLLWNEIKNHADHIELDEYVVMPNHVHGILILNGNRIGTVGTTHALSLPPIPDAPAQSRFQNQGKNTLSSIIGSYKSAVSKHAHRLGFDFAWQSRFHDHIIRNEEEYQRIANYIRVNPANWKEDKFF